MAIPSISDLKTWVGTLFSKDDWDFNCNKIVSWLSDGSADLVVGSVRAENGIDMDGSKITNVGPATTGSDAVSYDQAQTLLNRTSYFYPFSIASGKVDADGNANYLQKDSDTQVTVLAGNTNPDLVVIQSDGTVESITSNTVLTIPTADGTYNIIKEKENTCLITSGKVTIGIDFPASQNAGDYFLNNGVKPFVGYKYDAVEGWVKTPFCLIGTATVASGVATVSGFAYNNNRYDLTVYNFAPDYTKGISKAWNTEHTADESGWVRAVGYIVEFQSVTLTVDGVQVLYWSINDANGSVNMWCPIKKGQKYKATGGNNSQSLVFYPLS